MTGIGVQMAAQILDHVVDLGDKARERRRSWVSEPPAVIIAAFAGDLIGGSGGRGWYMWGRR